MTRLWDSIAGRGKGFIPLPKHPDRMWGPSILPFERASGALSPEIKRPGREAIHSPISSAQTMYK